MVANFTDGLAKEMCVQTPKYISLEEVSKHNVRDDCWVIIDNKVYDVTSWLARHPGGDMLILNVAGRDCTDEFKIFHLNPSFKQLKSFLVGELMPAQSQAKSALSIDIDNLMDDLRSRGAFKPDRALYFRCLAIVGLLFAATLFCISGTKSKIWISLGGVCLGLFWQQLAFIGHDLGHHVVTHSRKFDDFLSLILGNVLQGISLEWWKHNHNTHHVVTNSVVYDPDIQHLPFLAISQDFFTSIYSMYHKRVLNFNWLAQFFVSYQHVLFYPIMMLARFNLYAQSFIFNLFGPGSRKTTRNQELVSMLCFWAWLGLILASLEGLGSKLLFLLVSHAAAGLVHVQICINHFSMTTYQGVPQHSFERDGYIRSQLSTTTNIDCPWYLDLFHGGLQFQVEHHLFPHVTRSNFRYVQGRLRELCAKHGLPYFSKSFFRANYDVICQLADTARRSKLSHLLWDGMNMNG